MSGQTLGRVAADLLIVDCDSPDAAEVVEQIAAQLRDWQVSPVLLESGGPGRLHLFAWVESAAHRKHLEARAQAAGLDTRPGRWIRPPLTRHRVGGRSRLISPSTPAAALEALSTSPSSWPVLPPLAAGAGVSSPVDDLTSPVDVIEQPEASVKRPLSASMQHLLAEGGEADDSAMAQSLTNAHYAAGWTFEEFYEVMADPANLGGASVHKRIEWRGEEAAADWLLRSWHKAEVRVADRAQNVEFTAQISRLRTVAKALTGRTASTDAAAFNAMLDKAERAHTFEVNMSLRELAIEIGVTKGTASAALARLVAAGFLGIVNARPARGKAAIYRITPSSGNDGVDDLSDPPLSHPRTVEPGRAIMDPGHDLWRNQLGLGKGAHNTYCSIAGNDVPVDVVVEHSPFTRKTIMRHLRTLAAYGLAERRADCVRGIIISDEQADALAVECGSAGRGERQRLQTERERQAFHYRRPPGVPARAQGWEGYRLLRDALN